MQFTFCKETGKQTIKQLSKARLSLVKSASARWQDNFFDTIEQLKQVGLVIASHRDCISTYTSKTHINRYLRKDGKMERMEYLIPKSQGDHQRLHLIFQLTVCFVVNAAKKKIQSIRIAGGNITLFNSSTQQPGYLLKTSF